MTELSDLSQMTIFTVYQSNDVSTEKELWKINGNETSISLTTNSVNNLDYDIKYQGGFSEVPVISTYIQLFKPKNKNVNYEDPKALIGSFSENKIKAFEGSIAEILIYDKVLNSVNRQIIESSLAVEYGITLTNEKNYLSSLGKVIYDVQTNKDFAYRIAGIGRDDSLKLYQKQSHSTQKSFLVTMGLRQIAPSNKDNNAFLNDNTFLIWGDNNLDIDTFQDNQSSLQLPLMKRQWKIQATGESIPELETTLRLNLSDIKLNNVNPKDELLLAIDNSGEGSFLPENTRYFAPSSVNNDTLVFERIHWDIDKSGSDVFSFGLHSPLEISLSESKPPGYDFSNDDVLKYEVNGGVPPFHYKLVASDSVKTEWESTDNVFTQNLIEHLGAGNYTLKVTDAFGAQKEAGYKLISPLSIAVNSGGNTQFKQEDNFMPTFSVYPNLSKDGNYNLSVKLKEKQDITIRVYNMDGRLISVLNEKGKSIYNLAGIQIHSAGTYIVVLQSNDLITTKKLVVE